MINNNINKLPKCRDMVNTVCESHEQFRLRRINATIEFAMSNNKSLKCWEVQRIAGIKSSYYKELKGYIDKRLKLTGKLTDKGTV